MSKKIGQLDLKKQITAFLKEKGCPQSFLTIWNHLLKINNINNIDSKKISGETYLNISLQKNFIFVINDNNEEKIGLIDFYTLEERKKIKNKYMIHGIFNKNNDDLLEAEKNIYEKNSETTATVKK